MSGRRVLREVGRLLADLRNPTPPRDMAGAIEMLPMVQTAMTMRPKTVKTAPVRLHKTEPWVTFCA